MTDALRDFFMGAPLVFFLFVCFLYGRLFVHKHRGELAKLAWRGGTFLEAGRVVCDSDATLVVQFSRSFYVRPLVVCMGKG